MTTAVDLQRSVPVATGFGYQARLETGARDTANAAMQYQGEFGRYEVRSDRSAPLTVQASGALVAIGGSLHAVRPIRNSFALVQVPGVEEVRGFASHQEVGRTDKRGNLLITDLLPYYANELSISDTDIPLNYKVGEVQMRLAPPYRGGAVARFPVQRVQRTMGRLVVLTAAGERPPAYGELTVHAGTEKLVSPVGADGQFYFDSLPAGQHTATVLYGDDPCTMTFDVPDADADVLDLGQRTCRQQ